MKKGIVTVVGIDTIGIMAEVCTYLAKHRINIMDISQTIVSGYFNMMMIIDLSTTETAVDTIIEELTQIGEGIGVRIQMQRQDIFESMHRI